MGSRHRQLGQGPPVETATDGSQKTGNLKAYSNQGDNVTFSEKTMTYAGKEVNESMREHWTLLWRASHQDETSHPEKVWPGGRRQAAEEGTLCRRAPRGGESGKGLGVTAEEGGRG